MLKLIIQLLKRAVTKGAVHGSKGTVKMAVTKSLPSTMRGASKKAPGMMASLTKKFKRMVTGKLTGRDMMDLFNTAVTTHMVLEELGWLDDDGNPDWDYIKDNATDDVMNMIKSRWGKDKNDSNHDYTDDMDELIPQILTNMKTKPGSSAERMMAFDPEDTRAISALNIREKSRFLNHLLAQVLHLISTEVDDAASKHFLLSAIDTLVFTRKPSVMSQAAETMLHTTNSRRREEFRNTESALLLKISSVVERFREDAIGLVVGNYTSVFSDDQVDLLTTDANVDGMASIAACIPTGNTVSLSDIVGALSSLQSFDYEPGDDEDDVADVVDFIYNASKPGMRTSSAYTRDAIGDGIDSSARS